MHDCFPNLGFYWANPLVIFLSVSNFTQGWCAKFAFFYLKHCKSPLRYLPDATVKSTGTSIDAKLEVVPANCGSRARLTHPKQRRRPHE